MKINEIPEAFSATLRIKIIAALTGSSKTFNELLELTQATRGNLSVQLTKLEEWEKEDEIHLYPYSIRIESI